MPEFQTLNSALANANAAFGAAEAHGILCAILCAEAQQSGTRWLNEVFPDAPGPDDSRDMLGEQFALTYRALEEGQMDFMPLLPSAGDLLDLRAISLGQWCQGFLIGLGLGGIGELQDKLSGNVSEVMSDLEQIAKSVSDDGGEEDEAAFTEVLEYLRVSIQLIYEELAGLRGDAGVPPVIH